MLESISQEYVYHFMLIVARVGAAFSNFPGVSSKYIMPRGRLVVVLSISIILFPLITPYLPKLSKSQADNFSILLLEVMIGILIGIASQIYYNVINFVGQIIAMQSGLGMATFYDPTQKSQVSLFANFITLLVLVTIFASDIHYYYIQTISDSYAKFPPGETILAGDVSKFLTRVLNDSFVLAFKLSSPYIVVSLAIMTGTGLLSRLMPNLQIFFILTPAQILIVIMTMYIVVNTMIAKIINITLYSINVLSF